MRMIMEKLTSLTQLRMAAQSSKDLSTQVAAAAAGAIEEMDQAKQDKLSGPAGQFVGFGADGNAESVPSPVRGGTQAEYDALTEAEKMSGLFIITDADPSPSGGGVSKEYVDGLAEGKQDKLSGLAGQLAGFDAEGNLTAVNAPAGGVSQEYVDGLIGNVGAILDEINGEVV